MDVAPGNTPPSLVASILHQRCPRCRSGPIFRTRSFLGFARMYERCPVCDLKYEREPGYFLGAMYISYGLATVVITAIALVFWGVTALSIATDFIWATLLFLPFIPLLTVFARVLWMYLDHAVDPERPSGM